MNNSPDVLARFKPMFEPQSIAVIGASEGGVTPGNEFIRHSRALGYRGKLIPLHPRAAVVEGEPAVRSFGDIAEVVDYAYFAVAAAQIPELIASAAGKLRFAHVMSSGFGEIEEGRDLERRLAEAARVAGVRVLGPNCMGVYSPRGGITFIGGSDPESGSVGIVSQSGGLAVDMILRGRTRGLKYSGMVTIGNSVDVGPAELLEFFVADPATRVVGFYMEDVKDGRRFFEALRKARAAKPVVLLLGGQTTQGRRAAASHTGSLASDLAIWQGLARQTGLVLVQSLEQFLDVLLTFQCLVPRTRHPTREVVLFGNGGGTSVLAADEFGRHGLTVAPMANNAIDALAELKLPPGTSIINPIDAPAGALRQQEGAIAERILDCVYALADPDAVVMHINLPVFVNSADQRADFLANLIAAALRVRGKYAGGGHFLLVLRSDGSETAEARRREFRRVATQSGIPVYDEIANAAPALAGVAAYERFIATRASAAGEVRGPVSPVPAPPAS
jgi:acyl-CoA synthetase (NDP forming)